MLGSVDLLGSPVEHHLCIDVCSAYWQHTIAKLHILTLGHVRGECKPDLVKEESLDVVLILWSLRYITRTQ